MAQRILMFLETGSQDLDINKRGDTKGQRGETPRRLTNVMTKVKKKNLEKLGIWWPWENTCDRLVKILLIDCFLTARLNKNQVRTQRTGIELV